MICTAFPCTNPNQTLIPDNSACWTLLYLGTNNEWKDKATVEVRNLIVTYTDTTSSEPISQRLSTIPISSWEDEMPFVESIIRETMRIVNNLTLLRRSVTDNVQVGGKAIDKGAFLVYNMADVHLNKMFYSDPLTFDPDRFSVREREDKQESTPFLGWGTGRHPCTGQVLHFYSCISYIFSMQA
jgi:cytochrome P450